MREKTRPVYHHCSAVARFRIHDFEFTIVIMTTNCTDNNVHCAEQELTSEDKKYAAAHLNETDEIRESAIAEIRCWIEESGHLPGRIDDDFLILRFLRVCKFNLEKTKERIRNYCKHRSDLPEWFKNMDPFRAELQELLEMGVVLPLRKPDNQGRLIFIIRGNLHDPRKHKIPDLAKICILVLETMMKYYPAGSIYGYSVFVDTNNLFIRQILQFTPFVLRNMVHTFQKCYPMRYHKIVVFNTPKAFEVIIEIMKTFMSEKLKNRFHVYSHKHCFEDIPAHILPVEYGGTDGTLEELTVHWKKLIEKNRDWITKMTE